MDKYKRKALFSELTKFDASAKGDAFIEVTEWHNGNGFDVEIVSDINTRFQLSWGEYDALLRLIKKLSKL